MQTIKSIFTLNLIQGVANEVIAISVTLLAIISYLIYTIFTFIKRQRERPLNLNDILSIFSNNNNNDGQNNHANAPNNYQDECRMENNCSICLNQTQYEITTSCFHLFCGF